jgi:hypothetical protein
MGLATDEIAVAQARDRAGGTLVSHASGFCFLGVLSWL